MTPRQLYARTPQGTSDNLYVLRKFVPEIDQFPAHSNRVEIRCYEHHHFDHRRIWVLAGVFLDGRPVMVIQEAGRDGDDHVKRYVTDWDHYKRLVSYLWSRVPEPTSSNSDELIGMDDDVRGLTEFYGGVLGDTFGRIW